ncbi:MAG: flagellar filament capping protein FliD [Candidatus Latescibacteria bacterium]|nr:flagellar filament capping protein FliD [bacterium]MBD3425250.1 flagellar filament capping protein FliD [Candidatus Latescibacterota bacterium]
MAGMSVDGLASGLNTTELIDTMIEYEMRPVYNEQNKIKANRAIIDAFSVLKNNLLALKTDANGVYRRTSFLGYNVTSSDEDVLTASAGRTAGEGSYTFSVSRLAQKHQVSSAAFSDRDSTSIGTGTISIQVGSGSAVEIEVDSGNNTLQGIADAINASDADLSAMVVDVSGDESSYKLLLSGNDTGENSRIIIDEDLTGGTGLQLGSVDDVVNGTWSGSSQAVSGGNYTGNTDATFSFTVTGGGTVGSDEIELSYTDGGDISGVVTIPSSAAPGTEFEFYGGASISLEAGTVTEGDTFSVGVTSSTVQAPLNSQITLGNSEGGGTPIMVENSSNTISGLIEGVTLNLHKADPSSSITIDVGADTESMKEAVTKFTDRYNKLVEFFNKNFSYDSETREEGGALFGSSYALSISESVRSKMTGMVFTSDNYYNNLPSIGITTDTDGKLTVNEATLQEVLEEDPGKVADIFSTSGNATDANIEFMLASADTRPSHLVSDDGYEVNITVAASQADMEGSSITSPDGISPLVVSSSNNTLKMKVNGNTGSEIRIAEGSYTSGAELAEAIENAVNSDSELDENYIEVRFVDEGGGNGHFLFNTEEYGSDATIEFMDVTSDSIYTDIGVSTGHYRRGTDVAGTINGEEATGNGQFLTGNNGNEYTDGLRLKVNLTREQLSAQGGGQGRVTVSTGIGSRVTDYINDITAEDGAIASRIEGLEAKEDSINEYIDSMKARIEKKKTRLTAQFLNLETAISEFQSQESAISGMLSQLNSNNALMFG